MGLDGKIRPNLGGWRPAPMSKKRGGGTECRVCLEPTGEARDCCAEPLCQHCWSHAGFCPRCGVELKMVNLVHVKPKPGENIRAMDSKKVDTMRNPPSLLQFVSVKMKAAAQVSHHSP